MRSTILAVALLATSVTPLTSTALGQQTAEELIVHCVSLESGVERLACFDAAVKVAEAMGRAPRHPVAPGSGSEMTGSAVVPLDSEMVEEESGLYVYGGLVVETSLPYSIYPTLPDEDGIYYTAAVIEGGIGYNVADEHTLFGLEIGARRDLTQQTQRTLTIAGIAGDFPIRISTGSGGNPQVPGTVIVEPPRATALGLGSRTIKETLQELASPTLSLRVGRKIADAFFLYGRVGAGAAIVESATITDSTDYRLCNLVSAETTYVTATSYDTYATGCLQYAPSMGVTTTSDLAVGGTVSLGVGAEYHWDSGIFLRSEASIRSMFLFLGDYSSPAITQFGLHSTLGYAFR